MKHFLILACILFISPYAFAMPHQTTTNTTTIINTQVNPTAIVVADKDEFGAMADAPKVVRIFPDWYIGMEGGKALDYTNVSKGWFAYAKVTYDGTLVDFTKWNHRSND